MQIIKNYSISNKIESAVNKINKRAVMLAMTANFIYLAESSSKTFGVISTKTSAYENLFKIPTQQTCVNIIDGRPVEVVDKNFFNSKLKETYNGIEIFRGNEDCFKEGKKPLEKEFKSLYNQKIEIVQYEIMTTIINDRDPKFNQIISSQNVKYVNTVEQKSKWTDVIYRVVYKINNKVQTSDWMFFDRYASSFDAAQTSARDVVYLIYNDARSRNDLIISVLGAQAGMQKTR